MKQASNAAASSSANTRPNVSCEATPFSNGNIRRSHSSFASPNSATSTQLSAPHRMAHTATSNSSCKG